MWTRSGLFVLSSALAFIGFVHCGGDSSSPPALGNGEGGADAAADVAAMVDAMPDVGSDTGEGGVAAFDISPMVLKFGPNSDGFVPCGTPAAPLNVTIKNNGTAAITWTAAVTVGAMFYAVMPSTGTLAAGASDMIRVTPAGIPAMGASVMPDAYSGNLQVSTTSPSTSTNIPLHQTAQGAILKWTVAQGVTFGGVAIGQTGSQQFSISNDGNAAAPIKLSTGSMVFSVAQQMYTVMPSQSVAPTASFSPTNVMMYTDTLSIALVNPSTPLCGPLPPSVNMTGSGATAVSVMPTNLNFGTIQCGAAAAASQMLTIANTGPLMHWTPTFGRGVNSPYTLTDMNMTPIVAGNMQTLAASSNVTINVVPKRILAPASVAIDGFADMMTVTTDSPMDTPHIISLHETAQGAVLALSPTSISSSATHGFAIFTGFQVQNNGTLPASWTIFVQKTSTAGGSFSINLASGNLAGSQFANGTLTSTASNTAGEQTIGYIRLVPDVGAVMCSDTPPDMPISIVAQ